MKEASHYTILNEELIECNLCPHYCKVSKGKTGLCGVRVNENGKLKAKNYGRLSAIAIDPVEKKPLYHFYPSSSVFSIGSYGCTMHCKNCQNSDISQCSFQNFPKENRVGLYSIDEILAEFKKSHSKLFAFTYNEPVVFYEFMLDLSKRLYAEGIASVMISNGYINELPLMELLKYISAFNIDLKAFSDDIYRKLTGAKLDPVLKTINMIKNANKHLEITFLIIPGYTDNLLTFKKMIDYIVSNLGSDQVLHISRYFPRYKLNSPPTPIETMNSFVNIAREKLNYVYAGNINNKIDTSTYCPKCHKLLISRSNYDTEIIGIQKGFCTNCGYKIDGKFI